MRNLGLFAFGITTALLVPTAVHMLDAGPKQVAKLVAVDQHVVTIDGAQIAVKIDRAIVDSGEKVHVTLTATADKRTRAHVGVLVLQSVGSDGGRVETPPEKTGQDEIILDTKSPETATKTFAFTLNGTRGTGMEGLAQFGHYTIFVMKPDTIDKLDRLRRRAQGADVMGGSEADGQRYSAFFGPYYQLGRDEAGDDTSLAKPGEVARLDVNTRATGSPVSISVADTGNVDQDITVTVKVKNPTNTEIPSAKIALSATPPNLSGEYLGIAEDNVTITLAEGNTDTVSFKAKETKTVVFKVHASTAGVLGLYATAACDGDNCYEKPELRRINDGALDAIEIVPADTQPATVVLK